MLTQMEKISEHIVIMKKFGLSKMRNVKETSVSFIKNEIIINSM